MFGFDQLSQALNLGAQVQRKAFDSWDSCMGWIAHDMTEARMSGSSTQVSNARIHLYHKVFTKVASSGGLYSWGS